MPTYKKRKVTGIFLDRLPENAKELIIKNKVKIRKSTEEISSKYLKEIFLKYFDGFDFLENLHVVRNFLQKKYDIDFYTVEVLLYLYPKNFFTLADYNNHFRPYQIKKIDYLIKKGLIKNSSKKTAKNYSLFTLTTDGKELVQDFYKYLSGEKTLPVTPDKNKMALPESNGPDKKRIRMIKNLQKLPVPETKKVFWTELNPDDKS